MDYVPQPPDTIFPLLLCADMKYGIYDPIQWPQVYIPEYRFLCALRRSTDGSDPRYPCSIWWTPGMDTGFRLIEGSVFKTLGLLSPQSLSPLERAVADLAEEISQRIQNTGPNHGLDHFREKMQLGFLEVQRAWLMASAILDYPAFVESENASFPDVRREFMGAFTTDPAGIPVWHIRPNVSIEDVTIKAEPLDETSPPLYLGFAGRQHLDIVCTQRVPLVDACVPQFAHIPSQFNRSRNASQSSSRTHEATPRSSASRAKIPSTKVSRSHPYIEPHRSTTRGRDKFLEVDHKWMPPPIPAWKEAMESTDRSGPAKPPEQLWGYWVPEPALLVGPIAEERVERYIMNWLRLKPAWLYLLRTSDSAAPRVAPQWWRDYLNGPKRTHGDVTTRTGQQRYEAIKKVFSGALDMKDFYEGEGAVSWFSHRLDHLDVSLCPLILWELFELGFRYELRALDRTLVYVDPTQPVQQFVRERLLAGVFHDYDLHAVREIPQGPVGLAAVVPQARVRCLEALRRVVIRWPLCPEIICRVPRIATNMSVDEIETLERALASFYVHTFYTYAGRAPLVPHAFPSSR
ncbi:hypothetical protein OH77DRAFT_1495659 [Trametes cingulata]|nr:hypothetical protein OH77DRAFT_1495659 [Trametes cingulata]